MIINLLFFQVLFLLSAAFIKAPGTLTLKIKAPDYVEGCIGTEEACTFKLELCIGSGISINEQCLWFPKKSYNDQYDENKEILALDSFEVDDIRSSFYFNANLTFNRNDKVIKSLRYQNNIIQYDALNGTHTISIHSDNFVAMTINMDVACKLGYYPQFQCTRPCFGIPKISKCDNNGFIICMNGYVLLPKSQECVKDPCSFFPGPCQNDAICNYKKDSFECICKPEYAGKFCEIWNPCLKHKCQNSGKCEKKELIKDYICLCSKEFSGKYCEFLTNPCLQKLCPPKTYCVKKENEALCIQSQILETQIDNIGWFLNDKSMITTFSASLTTKKKMSADENDIRNRETVKLIQYPMQKDFTTISIIIVLLVFIMCCFGITLWMQRYKYFQKRKKYNTYPNIPPIPSVMNMPTYRSADDNFKRCHSLDDNSFLVCHQPHNAQFSTMSYKSGSNLWPRYESSQDSYKNWPPSFKNRMPMMNESSNCDSGETTGNLCESMLNNSEKMEDYLPDCVLRENEDLQIHRTSFN